MQSRRKHPTCTSIRGLFLATPSSAYRTNPLTDLLTAQIRDMIETFVLRAELSSPHGTGAELRKQQKEALAAVNRDRATEGTPKGGLFQGMFKPRKKALHAMRDPEDGILRCPECNWEVDGGRCAQCGRHVRVSLHGGQDFSDDYDTEDSDSDAEEGLPPWDDDAELDLDEVEEEDEEEEWEARHSLAERIRRLNQQRRFNEFTDDEEDEDEDDEDESGMGNREGGRNEPITLDDDSDLSLQVAYTNRSRAPIRAGGRAPPGVISQAREQRGRRRGVQESSEIDEDEEEDSEDEDEGSLEDFVVHDTPENRRRRVVGNNNRNTGNNRNGGVSIGDNRGFQNSSGPLVISSSPVIAAPTRRNARNARRTVPDTDEDEGSTISEMSGRPPPFLGEIRHDYNHRRGPIALSSDNDDDEEELLGPGMGYTPLEHNTASENEDDGFSSPPVRGSRRGQPSRNGPGSVFSVPEEDEDEESRGFGDDDESEDPDGDVHMGGQPQRRVRNRTSRPQILDNNDDSDTDSDVVPAPRRRRTQQAGNYFRAHHHNSNTSSTRRQREIVPNILDAFQQHRQEMTERQLDNLFRNSARSATPVQRHYTGGSNRGGRSTRESTVDSSWDVTPMGQSSPPPPFSPMFQGVSSSPAPMQPSSPGAISPRVGAGVRAGSESSNPWSPLASPQQQQQVQRPPQQHRQVPITIGSSPQATRVRTRNSRQQLRGSSSRAGLRVGSVTPTPTSPSVSTTSRQSSVGLAATRGRRGVALTTEDIRALGEAAVRRRQQEAAEAANNGLGRRNSRRDLAASAPLGVVGRIGSGLNGQGRRLGAVIGAPGQAVGAGPMLVIGSEDD